MSQELRINTNAKRRRSKDKRFNCTVFNSTVFNCTVLPPSFLFPISIPESLVILLLKKCSTKKPLMIEISSGVRFKL